MMHVRTALVAFGITALIIFAACRQKNAAHRVQKISADTVQRKDHLSFLISLDTFPNAVARAATVREDSLFRFAPDTLTNPFFHYFRGRRLVFEKQRDSAMAEFERMQAPDGSGDTALLKQYAIYELSLRNGLTAEGPLMDRILASMKIAERTNSRLVYRFYDLIAQAYYQNQNDTESLEYAERYFKSHPFNSHPVVMQRHYDISFLLASRMEDFDKMILYNTLARNLAIHNADSVAIARTYDNDARIYVRRGQAARALASSRVYVDYLKRTNNLTDLAYNNLATSFVYNKMADSAIYYYKEAIVLGWKSAPAKPNTVYYKGLINAYKMKGDYRNAMIVADSAFEIEVNSIRAVEAAKVAEVQEKYETEKKDRNIAELSSRNTLNEKIIRQQRWTLGLACLVFAAVLGFFYFLYRQHRLNVKNKLLQSENRRLHIEQKLLQAQLNPHFIFNSIANLQSLVATGDTRESVRYLSVFSGLLRNVLEQSRRDFISLEEEITTLDNYLQLQQMRFSGLFDYRLEADPELSPANILIPPMLVQPFIENAIEHGFRNIHYKGMLTIHFRTEGGQMHITIDDNGQGLTGNDPGSQKKQSLAGTILRERLEVLFKSLGQEAYFEITNKNDHNGNGVSVHIVIPKIID